MDSEEQALAGFFAAVRQGHVFDVADDGSSKRLVVLSQTCDVVLPKRPTITLAPVIEVGANELAQARAGAVPRYVPLPMLDGEVFADMSFIETRAKQALVGAPYVEGIDLSDQQRARAFSLAITRWFGRFAFPDEVVPWLRPLEGVIREKYRRESSALGQLLRDVVVEVRVEADWAAKPWSIDLHMIVRAEALPSLDGLVSTAAAGFAESLYDDQGKPLLPATLAERYHSTQDVWERSLALQALSASLAYACVLGKRDEGNASIADAVSTIEGQLWSDDDFPLSRMRKSEPLDLEYLSDPGIS